MAEHEPPAAVEGTDMGEIVKDNLEVLTADSQIKRQKIEAKYLDDW